MPIFVLELFLQCCMLFWPQNWMFHKVWPNIWVKITSMIDLHILQHVLVVPKKEALKNIDPVKSYGRSRKSIFNPKYAPYHTGDVQTYPHRYVTI